MNLIRTEELGDRSRIATLIARTYGGEGASVIGMASKLRDYAKGQGLGFVGEVDGDVVVYGLFTPVLIEGKSDAAVLLAPLAVDVLHADVDIAHFLEESFSRVSEKGYRYILVMGRPEELQGSGYVLGSEIGIQTTQKIAGSQLLVKDLGEAVSAPVQGEVVFPEFIL